MFLHFGLVSPTPEVAETSTADKVERMVAPFCIILGEEFYDGDRLIETQDTKTFDKATKIFFHNINTKTIPLTSEENLKVIIDDKNNFPDTELEIILGKAGIKTREFCGGLVGFGMAVGGGISAVAVGVVKVDMAVGVLV